MKVEERAKAVAGNHRLVSNLSWPAEPVDGLQWALIGTLHRDSTNIDKSNAAVIEREICGQFEADAHIERFADWLVGWSENLVIRVYDANGAITPAFMAFDKLAARMENYPLLDEELYSEMEEETIARVIEMAIEQLNDVEIKKDLPEGWVAEVRRGLDDYDSDIRGDDWWPRSEALLEVLKALDYLAPALAEQIET